MSPNTDNATARLLFAILKQKNLKDIDWNLVAQDPVLLQPIPNGHAARMRYSRFRSTVLGHSPEKRNKSGDKGRITKPGKPAPQPRKASVVKSESSVSLASCPQFSPASTTSPYMGELEDPTTRFLTPCSDDVPVSMTMNAAGSEFMDPRAFRNPVSPTFSPFDAAFDLGPYRPDAGLVHNGELPTSIAPQALSDLDHDWNKNFFDPPLF
ncbi:hypothetical protein B0I35DRAFT_208753 [Stachybotrys elegans]|uniref:Myb-like DNA-binding domain-containing protein n=1 Tax=Stachybotrys elegans TaxID=80388 RepID=A0A8K0SUX2_9HYPO|nr:hypothetical protein B0I35DRAFT_208753 [Stachybotrys elegans]